ncbi:unnamed protein product, partial [Rotaria sp. Silwood1]
MKEWTTNSESIQKNDNTTCTCCRPKQQQHTPSISDHNDSEQFERSINRIDVDKELFLWSVITDRRDLALLFWSRVKNKI